MKTRKILVFVLVLALMTVALIGCAKPAADAPAADAPVADAPAADAPAADAPAADASAGNDRLEVIRFGLCVALEGTDGAYFEVAKAMGYFQDYGVDISMEAAYGTNLAKMLYNGQLDMMYHAPTVIMSSQDAGMDIKTIMGIFPTNFFGVAVRADSDIETVQDMVGRKMAYLVETDHTTIGPILKGGGIDPDSVEWILAGESRAQMLEEGSVDIAYTWSYQAAEWNEKFGIKWFNGDDYVQVNCNGIVASGEFIEKYPDLCAAVCKGVAEGMYFCAKNPEAATEILCAKYPSLATNKAGVLAAIKDMVNASTILDDTDNFGYQDAQRWENNAAINIEYGNLSEGFDVTPCYTNDLFDLYKDWDRAKVEADASAWKSLDDCRVDIF